MQGKKQYQEKLFSNFQLSDHIPKENFYRRLTQILDLKFLYKLTEPYYGYCGQKSIDPVVFYKLCLVGYLENIISDRKLIDHCSMRMDILYFIGYDIDEPFPALTISLKQANKVMMKAGTAYNLKKYLKFIDKKVKSKAEEVKASLNRFFAALKGEYLVSKTLEF